VFCSLALTARSKTAVIGQQFAGRVWLFLRVDDH
jgi:hypothetical protein